MRHGRGKNSLTRMSVETCKIEKQRGKIWKKAAGNIQ